jgi:hypothetical protein
MYRPSISISASLDATRKRMNIQSALAVGVSPKRRAVLPLRGGDVKHAMPTTVTIIASSSYVQSAYARP